METAANPLKVYDNTIKRLEWELPDYEQWLGLRERFRTDLFWAGQKVLAPSDPSVRWLPNLITERTHRPICDLFIKKDNSRNVLDQSDTHIRLLLYPRGSLKTTFDCYDTVQWFTNFPDIPIGFLGGTHDFAQLNLYQYTREFFVIRDPKNPTLFQKLFPDFCVLDRKEFVNDTAFRVPCGSGILRYNSIEGGLSGNHFVVLKIDDSVHNRNSLTADQLLKTINNFNTNKPITLSIGGYIDLIGTRYHLADLYGWALSNYSPAEMKVLCEPAWRLRPSSHNKEIADYTNDDVDLLYPERLDLETLKREAKDYRSFACQYLNDPVLAAAAPFTVELLKEHVIPWSQLPHNLLYYIAWDIAYTDKKERDATVGVVGGLDEQGRLYIVDMIRGHFKASEISYRIAESYRQYRPRLVEIENSNGAEFLNGEIRRWCANFGLSEIPLNFFKGSKMKGAKESRITTLQALFKANRIYIVDSLPNIDILFKEFCEYPGGAHDDIPDCVSFLQRVMPNQPTASENSEIFREAYKELRNKRKLELIFGGSESTGAFDPFCVADDVPDTPDEYVPHNPFGL